MQSRLAGWITFPPARGLGSFCTSNMNFCFDSLQRLEIRDMFQLSSRHRFGAALRHGLLTAALGLIVGCNSAPPPPTQDAPVYNSLDELKQRLEEVAQNGDGGSALMGLSESIEKLRQTDKDKADKLAQGLDQLEKAPTTEQRKSIAKKMLEGI